MIEPPNAAQTNAHDGKRRKRGLRAIDGLAGAVFGAGTGEAVVLWGGLTLGVWAFAVRPGGPPMGRLASVVAGVLLLGILGRAIYLLISASPHRH